MSGVGQRRANLPKWAQHELESLRASVDHWKEKALDPARGASKTAFIDGMYGYMGPDVPLASDNVLFRLSDGTEFRVSVRSDGHEDVLSVDVSPSAGAFRLDIEPRASNLVYLRGRR